jgi:4'-phosphopantetheinyl transferase
MEPTNSPTPAWSAPPESFHLESDEVHVWRATLDQPAPRVQSLWQTLAADEQARARRFYFEKDRVPFIIARGALRAILGGYLNINPDQLRFYYSPHGKPALASEVGGGTLRFNVSHSHGLALFAISRGRDIGIDIEHIRPDFATEEIAERFFSPREVAALRALPIDAQAEAFFNCWTRKEAYIKAIGEGLSHPLDQFDVSLAPGEPARLLKTQRNPQQAAQWSLQELSPGPGYAAALAVEGHGWRLHCWQWPDEQDA